MSSKITRDELQQALSNFAAQLGLNYSPWSEEFGHGKINEKFLPTKVVEINAELTEETKTKPRSQYDLLIDYYWGGLSPRSGKSNPEQVATLLGKVNAIAEHLGVTFEVSPEKVITTPVKVKAVKKTATKKTPVKAVKKGKK